MAIEDMKYLIDGRQLLELRHGNYDVTKIQDQLLFRNNEDAKKTVKVLKTILSKVSKPIAV